MKKSKKKKKIREREREREIPSVSGENGTFCLFERNREKYYYITPTGEEINCW